MFRRRVSLDAALLERVSDASEVPLGTYPEAVLAVTGVSRLGSAIQGPGSPSPVARLDDQARNAAMQTALDQLIANGTVGLEAGTPVTAAVAAGQSGKLPVTGDLGELCRLMPALSRFKSGIILHLKVPEGLEGGEMPPGVPPPGYEYGYTVPFGTTAALILLVERADFAAHTRSYTLRTLRAEVSRMADFLFCDPRAGGVLAGGPSLQVDARVVFSSKRGLVMIDHSFTRSPGDKHAVGRMIVRGATMSGIKAKETDSRPSRDQLVNAIIAQFLTGAARVAGLSSPRWY